MRKTYDKRARKEESRKSVMTDILVYIEAVCIMASRFLILSFVSQRYFGNNSAMLRIRFIPM